MKATEELTTAYGSLEFKGHVPDYSDPMVEHIVSADGNVFFVKSMCPNLLPVPIR